MNITFSDVGLVVGDNEVLKNISLRIRDGLFTSIIGPNGAGKTTTMRTITGYLPPTSGEITVSGYDSVKYSLEARRHIGYLPETVPLYLDMTVTDYLSFMGKIRGMNQKWINGNLLLSEHFTKLIPC